jgi:TRAP-type C4-dicarboxylate transport system permease small subunit
MAAVVLSTLRRLVSIALIFLYAFMCVAVFAQVLGRYVFNFSIDGAVESATFAQIWMVLLGTGVAMRLNMHNGMDMFATRIPLPLFRALLVVSAIFCLWFLGITIWGSKPLLEIGEFQTSPSLDIPMWMPYAAVPIGCAYFALEFVLFTAKQWAGPQEQASSIE